MLPVRYGLGWFLAHSQMQDSWYIGTGKYANDGRDLDALRVMQGMVYVTFPKGVPAASYHTRLPWSACCCSACPGLRAAAAHALACVLLPLTSAAWLLWPDTRLPFFAAFSRLLEERGAAREDIWQDDVELSSVYEGMLLERMQAAIIVAAVFDPILTA